LNDNDAEFCSDVPALIIKKRWPSGEMSWVRPVLPPPPKKIGRRTLLLEDLTSKSSSCRPGHPSRYRSAPGRRARCRASPTTVEYRRRSIFATALQ
jgi:hypothetical protein